MKTTRPKSAGTKHRGESKGWPLRHGIISTMEKIIFWGISLAFLFAMNINLSTSICYHPPNPVKNGEYNILNHVRTLHQFPNGTKAKVSCKPGFHVASAELKTRICLNKEWTNNPQGDNVCIPHVDSCGHPPLIHHGNYAIVGNLKGELLDYYQVGTRMHPVCEPGYTLSNCTYPCGIIRCERQGNWIPTEGDFYTSCSTGGQVAPFNDSNQHSHHDFGHKEVSSYMILLLALILLLAIGAIILFALRRPIFCKKQERTCFDEPAVIITSSSPAPGPTLDSLPVAMNTGIFLPGVGYDLQDCNFQDIPIVGTTVFK